jgi:hypothetical protein
VDLKLSCGITGSTNKRNQKRNETIVNNHSAQWRPKILAQYSESPAPAGEGGRVAREPQRELVPPALAPPPAPDPAALAPAPAKPPKRSRKLSEKAAATRGGAGIARGEVAHTHARHRDKAALARMARGEMFRTLILRAACARLPPRGPFERTASERRRHTSAEAASAYARAHSPPRTQLFFSAREHVPQVISRRPRAHSRA